MNLTENYTKHRPSSVHSHCMKDTMTHLQDPSEQMTFHGRSHTARFHTTLGYPFVSPATLFHLFSRSSCSFLKLAVPPLYHLPRLYRVSLA